MSEFKIILPSKPQIISEDNIKGTYEIEGLYPGYGHTLGNSLRRIILSSLPGVAITAIKIDGANHEFSTIEGIKEDIITIILNLKKVRFKTNTDDPQTVNLNITGPKEVTAKDLETTGGAEVCNPEQHIVSVTKKGTNLKIELIIEKGLGYVSKESLKKNKSDVGQIAVDAIFTPIKRVNYEVDNMRVGTRTDYNKLRIFIETDGIITPKEALEKSIEIMINQLKAIVGFKEEKDEIDIEQQKKDLSMEIENKEQHEDILKTRIEDLNFSVRTMKALSQAGIRTIGGLARKNEDDLLSISGLGDKGMTEIKRVLSDFGITLK